MFTQWRSINQENGSDVTLFTQEKGDEVLNQEKGSDVTCLLSDEVSIKKKVVT